MQGRYLPGKGSFIQTTKMLDSEKESLNKTNPPRRPPGTKGPSCTLHPLHILKPVLFSLTAGDAVFVLRRHRVPAYTQH